jgi:thiol-disulfide isomerase/thioredoxin
MVAAVIVMAATVAGTPSGTSSAPARADAKAVAAVVEPAPHARPRLIHVWASWCVPCVAEWPALAERFRRWSEHPLDIVSIALEDVDDGGPPGAVLQSAGAVPGRHLWTTFDGAVPAIRRLDPEWDGALPTTFIVDAHGTLVLAQRGVTRMSALDAKIEALFPPGSLDAKKPSAGKGRDHEEAP